MDDKEKKEKELEYLKKVQEDAAVTLKTKAVEPLDY